ncbi:hypothetical protein [Mesorhizobium sp. M0895]|uniref:hypothetical protein n=1 Tax=Mesorhizobium sp. M0895 TaxID=2957019 RepID=UPI0033366F83
MNPEELQAFRKAAELIAAESAATAFAGEASPKTIADQLRAGAPASFGIGSVISDAVSAVTGRVRNAASTLGFGAIRGSLSPSIGLFMGDVLVYLKEGERREKIREEVAKALKNAMPGRKRLKGHLSSSDTAWAASFF